MTKGKKTLIATSTRREECDAAVIRKFRITAGSNYSEIPKSSGQERMGTLAGRQMQVLAAAPILSLPGGTRKKGEA